MWKVLVEKFSKSEFFVTLVAMLASAASKKLGLPDEVLSEFILSMTGLAVAYIGGRSYSKPKELASAAGRDVSLVAKVP